MYVQSTTHDLLSAKRIPLPPPPPPISVYLLLMRIATGVQCQAFVCPGCLSSFPPILHLCFDQNAPYHTVSQLDLQDMIRSNSYECLNVECPLSQNIHCKLMNLQMAATQRCESYTDVGMIFMPHRLPRGCGDDDEPCELALSDTDEPCELALSDTDEPCDLALSDSDDTDDRMFDLDVSNADEPIDEPLNPKPHERSA